MGILVSFKHKTNAIEFNGIRYNPLKIRSASSADLEVQLMQLNHCDGVYSNY